MAFVVTRTWNNSYHCCCHDSWDGDDQWFDSRDEALAQVPRQLKKRDEDDSPIHSELEKIEVRDGATGEVIAHGALTWIPGRGYSYTYVCWSGWIGDERFEDICGGQPGESWSDVFSRVLREQDEKRLKKAEEEFEAAKNKLERLKK